MSEMATILQNANHSSLIIIDELARSNKLKCFLLNKIKVHQLKKELGCVMLFVKD